MTTARNIGTAPAPSAVRPVVSFTALAAVLGGVIALGLSARDLPVFLPLATFVLSAGVAGAALRHSYPHARLGLCNAVTLGRLALTAALTAGLLAPSEVGWAVAVTAGVALALDGVDGWLARRSGLTSEFGARFDMEVDAALGLVLAVFVVLTGKAGLWVLTLGVMRYLWIAAGIGLPWMRKALPESFRRKAVCVIQVGALAILALPPVSGGLATGIAGIAVAALLWSFATDFLWLWRRR